jgi:phage-related protein (TIGR01555 family)
MSSAPIIPASFHCEVGRTYRAEDARAASLGLIPASRTVSGADAFTNAAARMGWGTPNLAESADYELIRISYDYWLLITLYRNHWISRRIIDAPAQDMVRTWVKIQSEMPPDDIARVERAIRLTRTKSNMLKAIKWARLFGGAGALIILEGHENKLDEPLKLDEVELGSYRGIIPFDRWVGITPDAGVSSDVTKPLEFNLPEHYRVSRPGGQGFRVHASRILRFCGPDVPAPENQAQLHWGISALELTYEEIRKRDNMSWNILSLTFRANLLAMRDKNLAGMLSGASMNAKALALFEQRMTAMNHLLSNQSMMVLPEDGELTSVNYSFAGLSDIYQQFQLDIAGAAQIPVTRLFGRTLTGLGQSNDADEAIYEERIAMEQDEQLLPQLDRLYAVICASELGEVPDDITLTFPSIRVLSEDEKSKIATESTSNVINAMNSGLFDRPQALKEIKQQSALTGFGTNITDEDIEAAEKAESLGLGGPLGEETPEGDDPEDDSEDPVAEKKEKTSDNLDARRKFIAAMAGRFGNGKSRDAFQNREFGGVPITVERSKGQRRVLKNDSGNVVYDRTLLHDYGFIRGTIGRDGDEVDVIIGPDESAANVFVADMIDLGPDVDKRSDEDKVLLGFRSEAEARAAFLSMYPPEFLGSLKRMSIKEFADGWLATEITA